MMAKLNYSQAMLQTGNVTNNEEGREWAAMPIGSFFLNLYYTVLIFYCRKLTGAKNPLAF